MRCFKSIIGFIIFGVLIVNGTIFGAKCETQDASQEQQIAITIDSDNEHENINSVNTRNNFEWGYFLSILGIGLLKFIDDKIKVLYKGKLQTYKQTLRIAMGLFLLLEIVIFIFYIFEIGSPSFGNVKNILLGFIPVIFCGLTLLTANKDANLRLELTSESELTPKKLETKINEFTSKGSSPLGMIVGDMDFLGDVKSTSAESKRKKEKNDIRNSSQIKALCDNNIDNIQIVCKRPIDTKSKLRVGYLLCIFGEKIHIKFFDDNEIPAPQMRGRIMHKEGVKVAVITKKIKKHSKYAYSEYRADSIPGGLFADLWDTIWRCTKDDINVINECTMDYNKFIGKKEGEEQKSETGKDLQQ